MSTVTSRSWLPKAPIPTIMVQARSIAEALLFSSSVHQNERNILDPALFSDVAGPDNAQLYQLSHLRIVQMSFLAA